ncbi:hypothetical protein [Amycolatopsis sp. FDAARGOS 1241]|uniref:hypothetical protein n=1 Tax=Amycolatopsis sp. FDAARGOS 1241 TaxID=2778070 RepID=UPI00194E8901|nr:hypothetical protein [Amycolatopsis sp. FDAARGOS 1241]QRP48581.1 hypothetical protein I6J71_12500 [Amycolatopsis sp. FDAARGOS 1241]
MKDAVNGKPVLRLPRLVARVDRAMATAAIVQAAFVLADFLLLGLLVRGVPLVEELVLVVVGILGPTIGVTRHFRAATRGGSGLVMASTAGSLILGLVYHFVLDGPGSLRFVLRSGATVVGRMFELSVTLHVMGAAVASLLAVFAFRRRTSVLAIGRSLV